MATREFSLAPFSSSFLYLTGAVTLVVTGILVWKGLVEHHATMYAFGLIPLASTAFFIWLGWAIHHCSIVVSDDRLSPRGPLYGRDIDRKALKVEEAKVVDVRSGELKPGYRSNGVGLPALKLGWFKLKNGERALLFLSDAEHAVYIPTSEGYSLLVSPKDTDGFLAALRR